MKADLLVIDGRHMLWRTTDAFQDLHAEMDGVEFPTGGIYGFLGVALRVHGRYGGRVVVAWEGEHNFRLDLFPGYKDRTRTRTDDELQRIREMAVQERHLIAMLSAMGVHQYRGDGCEADDVIGRLASEGERDGKRVIIYSGDSDLRQLVTENIAVVAPEQRSDRLYDPPGVEEKHGVPPRLLAQLKALSGDHSDAIPGVRGVGPVTAATLLNHYGSLKGVLRAAIRRAEDWPSTPRFLGLVRASVREVLLYYKLTRIRLDAPMLSIAPQRGQSEVVRLLHAYKFRSLASPAELHGLMSMGGR